MTVDDLNAAIEIMNRPEPERRTLYGTQDMIDLWKKWFGDSVDYVLVPDRINPGGVVYVCDS